jgi:formylglycine-generating enzyme required for sulfatase activity
MIKNACFIQLLLLTIQIFGGETILRGIVTLQNSKNPVKDVEISAFGISTPSDESGFFELSFSEKKPGDAINLFVRKNGMEVVNQDDIDHVVLRSNPDDLLKIVLCPIGKKSKNIDTIEKIIIIEKHVSLNGDISERDIDVVYQKSKAAIDMKTTKKIIGYFADTIVPPNKIIETFNGLNMEFRLIKGTNFLMGSNRNNEDAKIHKVSIYDFYMSVSEVTCAQFKMFAKERNREFKPIDCKTGNYPANNISWNDANDFCEWLSRNTGKRYRLPHESEWEFAARGGRLDSTALYWWGDTLKRDQENWKSDIWDSTKGISAINSFAPNLFGLYDMLGNVSEWTLDCYRANYFVPPPGVLESSDTMVIRGGNFNSSPHVDSALQGIEKEVTLTNRDKVIKQEHSQLWGFRIVREIPQTKRETK